MLRSVGRLCLALAVVVAAYIGWALWGTGFYTARAQKELREEFTAKLEEPRSRPPAREVAINGGAVAILRIPAIDVDTVVVEGTNVAALKKGPGHYTETGYPWDRRGQTAIAGHRTTYGAPFWSLDAVHRGDRIRLVTEYGIFIYRVTENRTIAPNDTSIFRPTRDPTLVLTTCNPRFSASQRLAVFAQQVAARR